MSDRDELARPDRPPPTAREAESWDRSQAEPLRRPTERRRRIDELDDDGYVRGAPVEVVAGAISYEVDPRPEWVTPETYAELVGELFRGMRETPERELDDRMAWIAERVWVVTAPPKLASDGGPYDLIGVAIEIAIEAKRRGLSAADLGAPRRRRLLGDRHAVDGPTLRIAGGRLALPEPRE